MSLLVLYHQTQAEVISSTLARVSSGPVAERRMVPDALGLVEPYGGSGERVIERIAGSPYRGNQPGEH